MSEIVKESFYFLQFKKEQRNVKLFSSQVYLINSLSSLTKENEENSSRG